MGLDMYLFAEKFFWKREKENDVVYEKIILQFPEMKDQNLSRVIFEVGYWRKANQIHKWFVDNVQGGNDDCGRYFVSKKQLKELKEICQKVLSETETIDGAVQNGYTIEIKDDEIEKTIHAEPGKVVKDKKLAEGLLPTTGFFFGSTDYDEYYLSDLENTINIIEKILKLPEDWDIYYHSSW
jgi:hypothetical protein